METNEGPQTREDWLENNRQIMEQEHETPDAVFYNQIQTRLAFDENIRNEADENLGSAYVSCLANYEDQADEDPDWALVTADQLITEFGVTPEEATVVVQMAREEYEPNGQ